MTSTSSKPASRASKVWHKTKEILAEIPEPEREQKAPVVGPETEEEKLKRLRRLGELNYRPNRGAPYSGHMWKRSF
jgi:hypothetical protein